MVVASAATLVLLGGCAVKHATANLVQGKIIFQKTCGSCHTLAHAATSGTTGPNLDDAFRQDRADGVKSTSIQGLIDYWIQYPNTSGVMPQKLVDGQSAEDVAAYVAAVAAKPGQDTGALASAGGVSGATAAAGLKVFTGVGGCGSCHTLGAAHTTGTVGPNLDQLKPPLARIVLQVNKGGGPMPAFKGKLTDKQIQDVAAFVYASTHSS